jgi:AcrR family transcriptional regulator
MDSPLGQPADSPTGRRIAAGSAATRERLTAAAAELIAERGWGRVTTRAVADRAGLPHGAVSYHFRGKQELLTEAAIETFERAFPLDAMSGLDSLADLLDMFTAVVGDAIDPLLSGLMLEAMREAERDEALRERLGAMLREYRELMARIARDEQRRGAVFAGADADGVATLLAAAADGFALHVLLDPGLDVGAAVAALRALLAPRDG